MTRLVFGIDRDPGIVEGGIHPNDLTRVRNGKGRWGALKFNPMLAVAGPGPDGATCRTCVHLFAQPGVAGHYLKCDQRPVSSGPLTDHRAKWPACGLYEPGREA